MTLRRVAVPVGRQTVADLSWASLRVPRCTLVARLAVPRALAARQALSAPRPPWPVLFAKALALVAEERPALRRVHATLPTPRLLEAPHAIGCIVLQRQHGDGPLVMHARFVEPFSMPLPAMARQLRYAQQAPPSELRGLHRLLRFARLPWPLRRLMLRWALATGAPLLRYGGTFAVSALGQQGVAIVDSVSVLPMFVSYGPIGGDGAVDVFFSFDHRVMDGADGAAALRGIETAMEGPIADELQALAEP